MAVADQRRALTKGFGKASTGGPDDRVDAEVDRRPVGHVDDPFGQVLAVDEDNLAARISDSGRRVLAPDDVDGSIAAVSRQLHQVQPHRRVGRVLDHPIAGPQGRALAQQQAAVGGLIVTIDNCSGSARSGSGRSWAASVTTRLDQLPQPTGNKTSWPTTASPASEPSSATRPTP